MMLNSEDNLVINESIEMEDNQNEDEEEEDVPEIDISISNVVCNFSTRCHLNLRQVATNGYNVEYKREQSMVSMKLRSPMVTASIWSSGKITITGATSEEAAKKAARRVARLLQKMGFRAKFVNYRVVNVLGTVILPFGIRVPQFTEKYRNICSYEPELHPGATYKFRGETPEEKATLKIFQTGAITLTAPSVQCVELAVHHIYPLVFEFKKEKPASAIAAAAARDRKRQLENERQMNNMKKRFRSSEDEDDDHGRESTSEEAEMTSGEEEEDLDPGDYSDNSN